MLRIGIGSIMQETNTWAPVPCEIEDFAVHGLYCGREVLDRLAGTNTEIAGAAERVEQSGFLPIPLVRAWASSSGRVSMHAFDELCSTIVERIHGALPLAGVVMCLHGAMASAKHDCADAELIAAVRAAVGDAVPIAVSLDLHANVTSQLVAGCDVLTGYRTYPHSDQAETGARAASLLARVLSGERLCTAMAKRPMIIPAEAQSTSEWPLAGLRRHADSLLSDRVVDISLFPVQPWLDVDELGFAVTVTTTSDVTDGRAIAEDIAERAWASRHAFVVDLHSPVSAIAAARSSPVRPFLLSHSADSPTAGATADSPAMIDQILRHGRDLAVYSTIVDHDAVDACWRAGAGAPIEIRVGARLDPRFGPPVTLRGTVERVGDEPVKLEGPAFTGSLVSIGRFALVRSDRLFVLVTERPAPTTDPAAFRHVGLDPSEADVIIVRSAALYKQGYPSESASAALTLDLDGASTPRLDTLTFVRAPRPLYPIDRD